MVGDLLIAQFFFWSFDIFFSFGPYLYVVGGGALGIRQCGATQVVAL